jgi:hypothetical protein
VDAVAAGGSIGADAHGLKQRTHSGVQLGSARPWFSPEDGRLLPAHGDGPTSPSMTPVGSPIASPLGFAVAGGGVGATARLLGGGAIAGGGVGSGSTSQLPGVPETGGGDDDDIAGDTTGRPVAVSDSGVGGSPAGSSSAYRLNVYDPATKSVTTRVMSAQQLLAAATPTTATRTLGATSTTGLVPQSRRISAGGPAPLGGGGGDAASRGNPSPPSTAAGSSLDANPHPPTAMPHRSHAAVAVGVAPAMRGAPAADEEAGGEAVTIVTVVHEQ